MPRIARIAPGGLIQHVLNRGNGRMRLFHKPGDYDAFVKLLIEAGQRFAGVRLLGWCLMPNHWHLALWPRADGELSQYMRWLSNAHVRRWHQHRHSTGQGHIYQGRFKNFPVQKDDYFLTLMRYIESNPLRAGLVERAEEWRWSSLNVPALNDGRLLVHPWPLDRPRNWRQLVNQRMKEEQITMIRQSVIRGRPLGKNAWVQRTATRLGLEFTLHNLGRPHKAKK